ncbi:predicted protein [Postia placenta Mad-698-R]|nr:predicted protein [Postia placenta Mad-698-R]
MHKALEIIDIIREILEHLLPVKPKSYSALGIRVGMPGRINANITREQRAAIKQLARAARVCKSFRDPALDLLWKTLEDIHDLLRVLPAVQSKVGSQDLEYLSLCDEVTQEDWARFQHYARRVRYARRINLDHTQASLVPHLFRQNGEKPLLPNLIELYWEQHCDSHADDRILSFISPGLRILAFHQHVEHVDKDNNDDDESDNSQDDIDDGESENSDDNSDDDESESSDDNSDDDESESSDDNSDDDESENSEDDRDTQDTGDEDEDETDRIEHDNGNGTHDEQHEDHAQGQVQATDRTAIPEDDQDAVTITKGPESDLLAVFKKVVAMAPELEEICLHNVSSLLSLPFFSRCQSLQRVDINDAIANTDVLRALASLQHLQWLHMSVAESDEDTAMSINGFVALTTLNVSGPAGALARLFTSIAPARLETLNITIEYTDLYGSVDDLHSCLVPACSMSAISLRAVCLAISKPKKRISFGRAALLDIVRPLLELHNLESVEIRFVHFGTKLSVPDYAFLAMAEAWPRLRSLVIEHRLLNDDLPTLACVYDIARLCPDLRSLTLYKLQPCLEFPAESYEPIAHELERFNMYFCDYDHVTSQAAEVEVFLYRVFPKSVIDYYGTVWEGNPRRCLK